MSFNVNFYGFSKKINSTKQPTTSQIGITLSCDLKDDCSILNPTITIKRLSLDEDPSQYNYAYIARFGRYYFINDWTWENGIWMAHMAVDTLASWKNNIGAMDEYILRASDIASGSTTSFFNGAITDTKYPTTTDFSVSRTGLGSVFVESLSQGCYIVGIISSEDNDSVGAVSYYAMTSSEFGDFKNYLFSDSFITEMGLDTAEEISSELVKAIFNPYQYISSCMWFPISKSDIYGTAVATIQIGWWSGNSLSGKRISSFTFNSNTNLQLPIHPQASERGKYLNYSPYTRHTLYDPPFGITPIDSSYFEVGDYLIRTVNVDLITGEGISTIFACDNSAGTNRKFVTQKKSMVAVPIQIAQVATDYLGTTVNLIDTIRDTSTGMLVGGITGMLGGGVAGGIAGALGGGIINGAEGIYNTVNSLMPQVMTSGSNGSLVEYYTQGSMLISQFFVIVDENLDHCGRPLCEIRKINTLSGYMVCSDADISFACMLEEKKIIHQHMVTGFFYE